MPSRILEVFLVFLRLGFTSFGGPVAHLSFFHDEFVVRRKWFAATDFADLVALGQFLPGPASSQVSMGIGLSRAGLPGAVAAWLGFTLPSAILLILFGLGVTHYGDLLNEAAMHGLKIAAVAVVAQALWTMSTKLCPDRPRATIAVAGAVATSIFSAAPIQVIVIVAGGIAGWLYVKRASPLPHTPIEISISRPLAAAFLGIFVALLLILPATAAYFPYQELKLFDSFYRAGSLVFGGGHVVLPLLEREVISAGWVSKDAFMAGYGAAQAIPGPLFTFTAYLGAVSTVAPAGWLGASICLGAAFLPSFLLVVGVLPFWEKIRKYDSIRGALPGINAAVVGLLLAAFYNPVWTSAIHSPLDFAVALIAFLLLAFWKWPPWAVVVLSAAASGIIPTVIPVQNHLHSNSQ
jgi:chromate transporter